MQIVALFLLFSMLATIWLDVTRYRIPNWLCAGVMLAYGVACVLVPMPWFSGLEAFAIALIVGIILFSLRLMGGGDVKLLAACALWTSLSGLADFAFLTAILGGVFALTLWVARKALALLPLKKALPRMLQEGAPMAYGVAIALAFSWMMYKGQIPGIHL